MFWSSKSLPCVNQLINVNAPATFVILVTLRVIEIACPLPYHFCAVSEFLFSSRVHHPFGCEATYGELYTGSAASSAVIPVEYFLPALSTSVCFNSAELNCEVYCCPTHHGPSENINVLPVPNISRLVPDSPINLAL